jgi:SAM-dependent methyltransferase
MPLADPADPAESDWRYETLLAHARWVAGRILVCSEPPVSPAGRYLVEQSRLLATRPGHRTRSTGIAADVLNAVDHEWARIASGRLTGEELFASDDTWLRLMTEWPMGQYARLAAAEIAAHLPPEAIVLELGAGVGVTTRMIRGPIAAVGGRLNATDRMYRARSALDFDEPLVGRIGPMTDVDIVVAVNALHCARDPEKTLGWIRHILPRSGQLVIAEGAPWPQAGVPWALNLVFGTMMGWYDQKGFCSSIYWRDALRRAGFAKATWVPIPSRRYDLGGVIHAWVSP